MFVPVRSTWHLCCLLINSPYQFPSPQQKFKTAPSDVQYNELVLLLTSTSYHKRKATTENELRPRVERIPVGPKSMPISVAGGNSLIVCHVAAMPRNERRGNNSLGLMQCHIYSPSVSRQRSPSNPDRVHKLASSS